MEVARLVDLRSSWCGVALVSCSSASCWRSLACSVGRSRGAAEGAAVGNGAGGGATVGGGTTLGSAAMLGCTGATLGSVAVLAGGDATLGSVLGVALGLVNSSWSSSSVLRLVVFSGGRMLFFTVLLMVALRS